MTTFIGWSATWSTTQDPPASAHRASYGNSIRESLFAVGDIAIGLPFRKDFRRNFAAPDQLMQIAENGPARDAKLARQRRDVRPLGRVGNELPDFRLPAQAVGGSTEQFLRIDALGAFQRFKLTHNLGFTALLERGFHRSPQFVNIDWLRDAIMRAARSL